MDRAESLNKSFVRAHKDIKAVHKDEHALIERCKNGDISAFDELMRRYEKQVYNFAYRLTGNYDDANDILSEAFMKVYNALQSFRGDANFTTWLFKIVTNTYLDERKRSKGHLNIPLDEYIELEESQVTRQIVDPSPSPSDLVERRERAEILQEAINSLPDYQRVMLLLYHGHNKSYEEIAEIIGLPIGTVKSRLNRARHAVRQKLESCRELFNL